ncbi:MAG: hypothetical protein ACERNK_11250, partial [Deltaproteobacteria bacterium]
MPNSNAAHILEIETTSHAARVASRFCGPPHSGNGGYTVGMIGKHLGPEVEVTLKRPIPVDDNMQVLADPAGVASLLHADTEIASARTAELDLDVPDGITFAEAAAARANFPGYKVHPFPNCYVCGTNRCCGD